MPENHTKPVAVVLGGTNPHIELIRQLQARGYYVVLVDYLPNPPAKAAADVHEQISTLDQEAVLDCAKRYHASLVISACVDQANATACFVAEALNLPKPYSYETGLDVTEKSRMKHKFVEGGVPTSDFRVFRSVDELTDCDLQFPLVVKPVDANSSKGVRKVNHTDELALFGKTALQYSRAGLGIVEQYCPGMEIQVDCVAIEGIAHVLMTRSKKNLSQEEIELNSCGSVVPAELSGEEFAEASRIAQKIADAFELRNTPFFYQARVDHGSIQVLEFAPRIGGGLSSEMIKRFAKVDVIDLTVRSYLGEPLTLPERARPERFLATKLLYMTQGVFGEITGLELLLKDGTVDLCYVLKKRGALVGSDKTSGSRIATLLMTADTKAELYAKTKRVDEQIDILDFTGRSCMARQ